MAIHLSPDVAALNPGLSPRERKLARLDGDGYRSELERRCALEWCPLVFVSWKYESIKLRIPGDAWYTPDFFGTTDDGSLAFVETKGYTKTLRADKLRYNAAREVHHWADWCWLEIIDGQWAARWNEKV